MFFPPFRFPLSIIRRVSQDTPDNAFPSRNKGIVWGTPVPQTKSPGLFVLAVLYKRRNARNADAGRVRHSDNAVFIQRAACERVCFAQGRAVQIRPVITRFAAARCAAALTASLDSSIQPIMHSTPYISARLQIFSACQMPPVFISLMLSRSAARVRMISAASSGENTLSSARIGVYTAFVTARMPSRSCAGTGLLHKVDVQPFYLPSR